MGCDFTLFCFSPSAALMVLLHLRISCPSLSSGLHPGPSRFLFCSQSFHFTHKSFPVLRLPATDPLHFCSSGKSWPSLPLPKVFFLFPAAGWVMGEAQELSLTSLSLSGCLWMPRGGGLCSCSAADSFSIPATGGVEPPKLTHPAARSPLLLCLSIIFLEFKCYSK